MIKLKLRKKKRNTEVREARYGYRFCTIKRYNGRHICCIWLGLEKRYKGNI